MLLLAVECDVYFQPFKITVLSDLYLSIWNVIKLKLIKLNNHISCLSFQTGNMIILFQIKLMIFLIS